MIFLFEIDLLRYETCLLVYWNNNTTKMSHYETKLYLVFKYNFTVSN